MQKWWDKLPRIPREKEWWIDKISGLISGCFTGCMVLGTIWGFSVTSCIVASLFVAKNFGEATTMGLAWGSSLGLLVGLVFGSAVLAVISKFRGV